MRLIRNLLLMGSMLAVSAVPHLTSPPAAYALVVLDDLPALTATSSPSDGDVFGVKDLGIYRFDAGSTATADGLHVLPPDVGSGRWVALANGEGLEPVINAAAYGLKAGGQEADRTTNKAALTAAIAVAASNNGTVVIPPGVYVVDYGIELKAGIRLSGYGATLRLPDSATLKTGSQWSSGATYAASALTYRNSAGDLFTLTTAGPGTVSVEPDFTVANAENWASGQTVAVGSYRYNGSRTYKCTVAGGGTTANAPVHTSGSATGGDGYQWTIAADGYSWKYSTLDFHRILTTSGSTWQQNYDSPPIVLEGLTLDGNRDERGTYGSHQQEHNAAIFLMGGSTPNNTTTTSGRTRAILHDMVMQETAGDALSVYYNADVQAVNCRVHDAFRGGLVVTGGWTKVQAMNWQITGSDDLRGVDVEIDGTGYDGTSAGKRVEIAVNGMQSDGGLDLAAHEGSVITFANTITKRAPITISGEDATLRFSDCDLMTGAYDASRGRWLLPEDLAFDDCTLRMDDQDTAEDHTIAHIGFRYSPTFPTDQTVAFRGCRFVANDAVTGTNRYGIYVGADVHTNNNRVIVDDCVFQGSAARPFTEAIHVDRGGNLYVSNVLAQHATTGISLNHDSTSYNYRAHIDNFQTEGATTWMGISSQAANAIYFQNCRLPQAESATTATGTNATLRYGNREILVGSDPTGGSVPGLHGDIAVLVRQNPPLSALAPDRWLATTSSTSASTWVPIGYVPGASLVPLEGSATYDAPSIAAGGTASTTVTVTGAALGNYVQSTFNVSLGGLVASSYVSSSNTVTIVLQNPTGSAIDPASATVRCRVTKH